MRLFSLEKHIPPCHRLLFDASLTNLFAVESLEEYFQTEAELQKQLLKSAITARLYFHTNSSHHQVLNFPLKTEEEARSLQLILLHFQEQKEDKDADV